MVLWIEKWYLPFHVERAKLTESKINSKFNESTPVFTKDGKTVYFTRNNSKNGKKKNFIILDAGMTELMRPALYGSYHHITVMGKENAPLDHVYDVTGSLCENNDKFAIQRELPKIDIGDRVIIHDAGAHGHSMGFNYNGKLRSAELLLHKDGSVTQIRRAETYDDLFGTLDFSNL